jgi:hypothetical protein
LPKNVHENQLPFNGTSYRNFINAIKSPATNHLVGQEDGNR